MHSDLKINQRPPIIVTLTSFWCICFILTCSAKNDREAIVNTALHIAQETKDEHKRNQSLSSIAMHFAGIGEYARAIEAADLVTDTAEKSTVIYAIALTYLEEEKHEEALHLSEIIEERDLRIRVACLTASKYAKGGNIDMALAVLRQSLELAKTIEGDFDKSETLAYIAGAYADAGDKEKAVQLLNQAIQIFEANKITTYDQLKGMALITIAEKYIDLGEEDRASMVLNSLTQKILEVKVNNQQFLRSLLLWYVVQAYARFGQCEQALMVVELIEDIARRESATVAVVEGLVRKGEYKKAEGLARKIEYLLYRNDAMLEVIRGYARSGYYERARDLLKELEDQNCRTRALVFVAGELKAAEKDSLAFVLLSQAHQSADLVDDLYFKAFALIFVAGGYVEIDQIDSALAILPQAQQVATAIQDVRMKDMLLSFLAGKYSELGKYNRALQVTKMISDTFSKVSALTSIASAYHESGKNPDAKAMEMLKEIAQSSEG